MYCPKCKRLSTRVVDTRQSHTKPDPKRNYLHNWAKTKVFPGSVFTVRKLECTLCAATYRTIELQYPDETRRRRRSKKDTEEEVEE